MDVDPNTGLPMGLAPVHPNVGKKNEFKIGAIFPFRTWRSLPSLSTALLNISISTGTLIVSLASLAVSIAVFLPIGAVKTVGDQGIRFVTGRRSSSDGASWGAIGGRRCVVINGASAGIGAALAIEYAAPDTHLVLIARDLRRLHEVAARVQSRGATVAVHSLDFFDPASLAKLQQLLQEVDTTAGGIDVAISCTSVTGHRSDVLGPNLAHIPPTAAAAHSASDGPQGSEYWGATTASRMLQVNVAACQEFILRSWELMKAPRRLQLQSGATSSSNLVGPGPKIIVLSSSTAFFTPATFALYAAAKAYLYSLARSLQVASAPYGIGVVAVTPGFMETGLTENMIRTGATCPRAILGDPRKLARKIKRSEEADELLVFYPVSQVWALFSARALNPLLETLGLWAGAATGVASWFFS
ncbi:uncharacterized protein B0T15DRAFT_552708 [Chaetomium strumarium]|uniref:NAD(P)-binding protein n=1 Tax=Chaetomium strumarium TaxID=1170767 RepID=A0AAJ0GV73_9PEZI|nr:hypothetical protein B0T15DRAFT_552708 [Chaetomium strumarium]